MNYEKMKTTQTEEYKVYMKSLCKLASHYVSRIRVQFAEKAYEMYQNETIRKLVLEYGKEVEKLEESRLRDFNYVSDYGATTPDSLDDTVLNYSNAYGKAVWFFFGIE